MPFSPEQFVVILAKRLRYLWCATSLTLNVGPHMYLLFFSISLLSAITSAAWAQEAYPSGWPKPVTGTAGTCISLSGTYKYHGEADRTDRSGASTIDRAAFNRMSLRGNPLAATFEHEVKAGIVNVRIEGDNVAPLDRANFKRKLTCEAGWSVNLRQIGNCENLASAPFDCRQVRLLYTRAEDESLIVHFTTLAVTKELITSPTKFTVDAWYRFELGAK